MSVRLEAVGTIGKRTRKLEEQPAHSMQFGSKVFSQRLMEQALPKKVYQHLSQVSEGKEKLDPAKKTAFSASLI